MKQRVVSLILMAAFVLVGFAWMQSVSQMGRVQAGVGPSLQYLGEGGSYTVGEGFGFLVKHTGPFYFYTVPGPTYTAQSGERVWSMYGGGGAPDPMKNRAYPLGQVDAGCVVEFQIVDDDVDDRINYFLLNGNAIYQVSQGMVTTGQFVVPEDGYLAYQANDSTGLWTNNCHHVETLTPTATATATLMPTETPEPTVITPTIPVTPTVTITGTVESTPTYTPTPEGTTTPGATATPGDLETPTPTATSTLEPSTPMPTMTATPTGSPTSEPTPKPPRYPACMRFNFEVGGDVARAGTYVVREIGGRVLASWTAQDGWEDSGWIFDIDITFASVYVEVIFYPAGGGAPITMSILNPAPGTIHGWMSRGTCHAIEIAWSGSEQFRTPVPGGTLQ